MSCDIINTNMTILTKNSKILSTRSAILEKSSKYVYELNIDNFDTSTLRDGDVQWSIYICKILHQLLLKALIC